MASSIITSLTRVLSSVADPIPLGDKSVTVSFLRLMGFVARATPTHNIITTVKLEFCVNSC